MAFSQKPSLSECLQTADYVKVYVGPERKMWVLNEELLCTRLDYFRAAFRGGGSGFQEGAEKSIHLAEEDPSVFACAVEYLHRGTNRCGECNWLNDKSFEENIKLCMFAERLGCLELRDELLYSARRLGEYNDYQEELKPELMVFIYSQTIAGSPIRERVVERATWDFFMPVGEDVDEFYKSSITAGCSEFMQDFMVSINNHLLEHCCFTYCRAHKSEFRPKKLLGRKKTT
ncbi:hypothetical protein HYFRA_00008004 [Hymenoscyphus fraxineus]|uniref:BTB domain-containing protein n=1 Tax=Hymenoscyphus fraxineus TaxID=746836 RepID=A0A9N9KQG5_9HELO|nr:hypothetical protein HYFRA_00008004 [Hymenoscyphus fraxineus]